MQDDEARRLILRAGRRGMREMDLILGPFAAERVPGMGPADRTDLAALMEEADADLLAWVLGQRPAPAAHAALVAEIAGFARARFAR